MKLKVAITGRPNVGKSLLVNRLSQKDDAIVHERRGVTRDRTYHECSWNGIDFELIDTGGLETADDDQFKDEIRNSALEGTNEANIIILVVDGKVGIQQDDIDVARILKAKKKPLIVAVNKLDNPASEAEKWEFMQLGLGEPMAISALHGTGTGDLLDKIVDYLKNIDVEAEEESNIEDYVEVSIVGRPNAGKSTLMNRLIGKNRSIVSDVAGTTRDSIDTIIEHDSTQYKIVDTAGLRKKSKIEDNVEYFSYVRAKRAIDRSDVAILVIDATLGITNEDQRIVNYVIESKCALVVVVNKWDLIEGAERKAEVRADIQDLLQFVSFAQIQTMSALTGKKTDKIWDMIDLAYDNYSKTIPTSKLNNWLSNIRENGHTLSSGKAILRLKYIVQVSSKPPTFQIYANHPKIVNDNYKRFLENKLMQDFDLIGTPIRIFFKDKG